MVKNTRPKIGIALAPTLVLMLFLTASVTTFFFVVQQAVGTATKYSGNIAAKWAARGGMYIAEEIMRNSLCDGCYTRNADNTANITPIGMDLPSYVTANNGFYNVAIVPVPWAASNITDFHVYIRGSVQTKPVFVTSDISVNYKSAVASHFVIDGTYSKVYMTDFFYYTDMPNDHVDNIPSVMNTGDSDGIRINGFWNIMPPWWGASDVKITAKGIEVSGYIRVLTGLADGGGTDDAGVNFGKWTWLQNNFDTNLVPIYVFDPINNNFIAERLPRNLFRLNENGTTYMDYTFNESSSPAYIDYQTDLARWNKWRSDNSVGTWFRDLTAGVQDFKFDTMPSGQDILETFTTRSNSNFTAPAIAVGDTPQVLKAKAQIVAGAINAKYGPGVATGRAIVNYFRGDNTECAVEIDMQKLTTSGGFDPTNNAIHIEPGLEADIGKFSVVLINSANLTKDVTVFVEGAVFTHGNINTTAGTRPLVTIIARDDQYVLSGAADLSRMYLGTAADESQHNQYDEGYIAEHLCIINPNYAKHIHDNINGATEYPLTTWYIDNYANGIQGKVAGYPATFFTINPANGQYWRYVGSTGTKEGTTPITLSENFENDFTVRNPKYGKIISVASPTTINAAIVNASDRPFQSFENWFGGVTCNYNGSLILFRSLQVAESIRRGGEWWSNALSTWWARSEGGSNGGWNQYPTVGYDGVHRWHGALYNGGSNVSFNYDNNLLNHSSPLTFDRAARQTWSETIR